jgi:glycosyltransferase involved in cell wall biosynthesis
MSKPTVLHIIHRLDGGGAEAQLQYLVEHGGGGADHEVFCVDNNDEEAFGNANNIHTFDRRFKWDIRVFHEINECIKSVNPDVVHIWLNHYVSIPALLLSSCHGVLTITSFRNRKAIRKPVDIIELCMEFMFCDAIISNSEYNLQKGIYSYMYKIKDGKVINNGYPLEKIRKKGMEKPKVSFDESKTNIIFVGRLAKQKDIPTLLKAIKALKHKNRVMLYICGDGPLKKNIKRWIRENGLYSKVNMLGYVDNVYPLIKSADVLVLPSKYEGMPNVLFESMILGTTVLVSNIKPHSKWIDDGFNGYIFEKGNYKDLANKILENIKKGEKNKSVKINAKKTAEKFKVEKMSERYSEYYRRISSDGG